MTEQALIYDLRQLYTFVVRPDALFLDTLAHFPLVYYMTGSIWSVDDLLVARITQDSYLVVVKRNPDSNYEGEEFLEDSSTIQKIVRLFPSVTVLTELTQVSYIKFMDISGLTLASKNLHVGQLCYIRHSPRVNSFLLFDFCWALMENKVLDICQVEESYCQEVPDVWSPVRRLLLTGRQVPFAIYRTQSVDNLKVHASSSSGHKADHNT
nr:potassium channel subfamily T member 2-like isoform X7 [Biomphalaria glabrata]